MESFRQVQVPLESADEAPKAVSRRWQVPGILLCATALLLAGFWVGRKSAGKEVLDFSEPNEFLGLAETPEVNTFALEGTRCAIDVSQSVFRLMRFSNAIAKVKNEVCKGSEDWHNIAKWSEDDKKKCAAAVLQIIYSFTIMISMVSQSVSDCAHSLNVPMHCTATITSFIGNTEVIFGTALDAEQACRKLSPSEELTVHKASHTVSDEKIAVKYKGKDRLLPAWTEVRHRAISSCVAEIGMGTTFVMRLATALTQSVTDCQKVDVPDGPRVCAVDLTGVLGALSFSVAFLSGGAASCQSIADTGDRTAACVSNIAGCIGGTLASLNAGINLKAACSEEAMAKSGANPSEVMPVLLAAQGPNVNMTYLDEMLNHSLKQIDLSANYSDDIAALD